MMRMSALLLPIVAAGCIWLPLGSDAAPGIALDEVQRSSSSGAEWRGRPTPEPDGRGMFFADSVIAFRTETTAEGVRLRLWNRGDGLMRIVWDAPAVGGPAGQCPAAAAGWEVRWRGDGPPADVVPPGASHEDEALAVARVSTLQGGLWKSVQPGCLARDPGSRRAPLRLTVQAGGEQYHYTFWYGVGALPGSPGVAGGGR